MIDYNPAVDGIGMEQLNTGLQDKLNQCFERLEQQGTEESTKQEISNLRAQVNLLIKIVHSLATDQVMEQENMDRLTYLRSAISD